MTRETLAQRFRVSVLRTPPELVFDWMRDPTHSHYRAWWSHPCQWCGQDGRACDALLPWPSGYDPCCARCGADDTRSAHDPIPHG